MWNLNIEETATQLILVGGQFIGSFCQNHGIKAHNYKLVSVLGQFLRSQTQRNTEHLKLSRVISLENCCFYVWSLDVVIAGSNEGNVCSVAAAWLFSLHLQLWTTDKLQTTELQQINSIQVNMLPVRKQNIRKVFFWKISLATDIKYLMPWFPRFTESSYHYWWFL